MTNKFATGTIEKYKPRDNRLSGLNQLSLMIALAAQVLLTKQILCKHCHGSCFPIQKKIVDDFQQTQVYWL